MICVVIVGPSEQEIREQIQQSLDYADLIELRLDLFDKRHPNLLKTLLKDFSVPMIFTLRSESQGGKYQGTLEEYLEEIKKLLTFKPHYLDIEAHSASKFFQEGKPFFYTKPLISYHDFSRGEKNFQAILKSMPQIENAHYKIALLMDSTAQTLQFIKEEKAYSNVTFIGMGEKGEVSRFIGKGFTFTSVNENKIVAPGQISAQALHDTYRYKSIHAGTKLYGLIGDPVTGSIGHQTNNALMKAFDLDAVYVKMKVESHELKSSLESIQSLGFQGLAVTMPLKEVILPYLDDLDVDAKVIGAVNTIRFDQGKMIGYNVDGYGALESLEKHQIVKNKRLVILGAGGSAKAIAFEALRRGAKVIILNRTIEKAEQIAKKFDCDWASIEDLHKIDYEILINCLPFTMSTFPTHFIKDALVMDLTTKPMTTPFLQEAEITGCRIVYGYEMFIEQTLQQFNIWFPNTMNQSKALEILKETATHSLR